jgi:serine/threonine-protein kinase HipA
LWNLGVLYAGDSRWRLAPAFDLNPFPDRLRESKTWLSQNSGPITSLAQLLEEAPYFGLKPVEARDIVAQVASAVQQWRAVATATAVGMTEGEAELFKGAFEHRDAAAARALVN